ncbi:hypothetical protein AAG570_003690 [Ranatra chinensis]|uniref:Uncharacterized protein n=1 Tax=Ranatra chinensis TaxID=642074 RepID=A0ABD0Y4F2_9HEMI
MASKRRNMTCASQVAIYRSLTNHQSRDSSIFRANPPQRELFLLWGNPLGVFTMQTLRSTRGSASRPFEGGEMDELPYHSRDMGYDPNSSAEDSDFHKPVRIKELRAKDDRTCAQFHFKISPKTITLKDEQKQRRLRIFVGRREATIDKGSGAFDIREPSQQDKGASPYIAGTSQVRT